MDGHMTKDRALVADYLLADPNSYGGSGGVTLRGSYDRRVYENFRREGIVPYTSGEVLTAYSMLDALCPDWLAGEVTHFTVRSGGPLVRAAWGDPDTGEVFSSSVHMPDGELRWVRLRHAQGADLRLSVLSGYDKQTWEPVDSVYPKDAAGWDRPILFARARVMPRSGHGEGLLERAREWGRTVCWEYRRPCSG